MGGGGRRLCSVSVDLDPIGCYYRIHGLGAPPAGLADLILRRALPRFLELFARRGLHATFFLVGTDIDGVGPATQAARALVREVVAAGHELGNHTHTHPYELARLPAERVAEEIGRAHDLIAEVAGAPPVGFRSPGYGLSTRIVEELERQAYRYSSSMFPAPAYYLAKAAVMAGLELAGRPSGAMLADPRGLLAPADPYRLDTRSPWRRGVSSVVELPVAVTPLLRLPAIGTSLILAPTPVRAFWLDRMLGRPFFNLELHGIDLVDADADGVPAVLALRQPDLRVSLEHKRRALEATLDRLAFDYRFEVLGEVAKRVQREGGL